VVARGVSRQSSLKPCQTARVHELSGCTAVVTGAASGIGRSIAHRLAAEHMSVVLADVEQRPLAEAAAEIERQTAAAVVPVATDVSNGQEVDALADRAFGQFGAVHVLCNNAGVFQGGLLWECTPGDFDWTLGVNLWGILHAIRAFVPRMLAQGEEAHIVNTASMAGLATTAYCAPYEVSKFAATAATECLAHDLASQGAPIKVSLLCPGSVDTDIARSRRNRPAHLVGEQTAGAAFVEEALAATTASGAHPDTVAALVVEAIREETFLVPTTASYRRQILERADALAERRLPASATFD
jgi:NAD(P)-dependent dehydrogenase (short-subunit alcohol dehydrogenase family)